MRTKVTVACALTAFVAIAGGTAEATGLVHTSGIAKGAITFNRLSPGVQKMVAAKAIAGTNGTSGANGVKGADGANGVNGADGVTGMPGAAGTTGVKGTDGAQGGKGDAGSKGDKGDIGAKGNAGYNGHDGDNGHTGPQGPKGDAGIAGPKGNAGVAGPKGDAGIAGAKGDAGIAGPKGDDGAPGAPGADSDSVRPVTAAHLAGFVLAPNGDNGDVNPNGTVAFAPAADAPKGTEVLDMETLTGKSVVAYLPAASGRLLSELTSFGYASKVISAPNTAYDVTAQIEVVKSGATAFASGYTTVVFEPYVNGNQGTVGWHRNDVVHGKVWSTKPLPSGNCSQAVPCLFSQFVTENPKAIVLSAPKFRIGQNSGTPVNDAGHYQVDDVIYGFGTTLNFDLGA